MCHWRNAIFIATMFAWLQPIPAIADDNPQQQSWNDLGKRLLAALQSGDGKAFLACWVTPEQVLKKIAATPAAPSPSEQQIRSYLAARDESLQLIRPVLNRALQQLLGEAKQLRIQSVEGIAQKRGGKPLDDQVTTFKISLTNPAGDTVTFDIDDGHRIEGAWYFFDSVHNQLRVERGGESMTKSLGEFATEEERAAIQAAQEKKRIR